VARENRSHGTGRRSWADNLKVVLVAGVIVAHVTMAWTGVGNWVFTETPVRDPLWPLLVFASGVGALFGMALFFVIAGLFTAPSLARKGTRRFVRDRTVRLGVPLLVYLVLLAPFIEYVDPENAGWPGSFLSFTLDVVWWSWPLPPAWGPAWFLAVLLAFSWIYAAWRAWRPAHGSGPLTGRGLLVVGAVLAVAAFAARTQVSLGEEVGRLALGQAPAWVAGFCLGVLAGERGWFTPLDLRLARRTRHAAWAAMGAALLVLGGAVASGLPIEVFAGGTTWQSALLCCVEAALVLTMPIWLVDVFQRRFDHQGPLMRAASRAAFAAFLVHQAVLVGLVLLTHRLSLPPEVDYLSVAVLGVLGSFVLGDVLLRLPGMSRVL
jgi:hypothetical protein